MAYLTGVSTGNARGSAVHTAISNGVSMARYDTELAEDGGDPEFGTRIAEGVPPSPLAQADDEISRKCR